VQADRRKRIEDLHLAGRELSTVTVLFHTAVAERRGLSTTEEKALDVLLRLGPLTHQELTEHTGLAAASVTNLIDRLERKGFARRGPHPDDKRRVLVTADAEFAFKQMAPLFAGLMAELEDLYAGYSDEELELIAGFVHQAAARQQLALERLPDGEGPG
jgi:DNA-binding MarR family transcriptional regulator